MAKEKVIIWINSDDELAIKQLKMLKMFLKITQIKWICELMVISSMV